MLPRIHVLSLLVSSHQHMYSEGVERVIQRGMEKKSRRESNEGTEKVTQSSRQGEERDRQTEYRQIVNREMESK